jgi:cell division GTPase FtsZ
MLVNIIGGPDFAMSEYDEAAKSIAEYCREDAEIIVGLNVDDHMKDKARIIIIATDFRTDEANLENDSIPIPAENIFEERKVVNLNEIKQDRIRARMNQGAEAPRQHVKPMDEDDFETPAFLRRRKMG